MTIELENVLTEHWKHPCEYIENIGIEVSMYGMTGFNDSLASVVVLHLSLSVVITHSRGLFTSSKIL